MAACLSGRFPLQAHDDSAGAIFPRISDSGETVAFSYHGAIWTMPRDGGVMTRLTHDEGWDVEPAWSPDGLRIAYIQGRGSFSGALKMIDATDAEPIRLPRDVHAQDRLFFDPDGQRILGYFQRENQGLSLCWFDLTTGELGSELRPYAWGHRYALSNSGETIVFSTTQDILGVEQAGNNGPRCDLWTMPADGGEPRKIVQFPARVYGLCWSADDQALYVVTNAGGAHNDLWKVPLDDPLVGAEKLTFGQADEDYPSVSRDGRWLLYTDNRHGPTMVVARDLDRGTVSVPIVSQKDYRCATGRLRLDVRDADSGEAVAARVSVRRIGGKYHARPGALYHILHNDMHFCLTDHTEMEVPAGRYAIKAGRGPEYRILRTELEVKPGETARHSVSMQRWTDQRAQGWYSGESHIHANYGYGHWYNSPRTMLAQCRGVDLNVCNFMVANSESDGVFDREYFRGSPDPLSTKQTVLYWNEEFRSTIWGHMTLLNLKQLVEPVFTGYSHTTHPHDHPTNADIAHMTHDQGGHVNYTHPAHNVKDLYLSAYSAKALPIDVALGTVDSIDVMGSNYLASMPLWYRLLNCGFRIPASAGTDCFLNQITSRLPGQERVYVKVDGEFTYQRWIDGLKAGRTFVTNAPMFEFGVNDLPAGDTIRLAQPDKVRVVARVTSQYPLDRVEVIYNGDVAYAADVQDEATDVRLDREISIRGSGWIAVRASGPDHPDQPKGTVFGHSSPIYVEVDHKPLDAREEAEFFLAWIDRLWQDVRKRNRLPGRHHVHVESQISQARAVYQRLAEH